MKKLLLVCAVIIPMLVSCSSMTAMFPFAAVPASPQSSMLVVEVGTGKLGVSENLNNLNYSGWAPVVLDSSGKEVVFNNFDAESRLDSFFYAQNLQAGDYVLTGFMHVYADYGLFDSGKVILSYEPYAKKPYQVRQVFPLAQPVKVSLKPASVETLGRYLFEFTYKEGGSGKSNDRWMVKPSSFKYNSMLPGDRKALRVMKNWATPAWVPWNKLNPETAADK